MEAVIILFCPFPYIELFLKFICFASPFIVLDLYRVMVIKVKGMVRK